MNFLKKMYFKKSKKLDFLSLLKIVDINYNTIIYILFLSILFTIVEGLGIALIYEIVVFINENDKSNQSSEYLYNIINYLNLKYTFANLCLIASILIIIRYTVEFFKMTYYSKVETNSEFKLRNYLIDNYLRSSITFFIKTPKGDLNFSIIEIQQAVIIFRHFFEIFTSFILSLVYILVILIISFKMTIFSICLIGLVLLILKLFSLNFQQISFLYSESLSDLNKKNIELFSSYKVIKSRGIEDFIKRGFNNISEKIQKFYFAHFTRVHFNSAIGNCTIIVGIIFVVYFGFSFFNISTSELVIFLYVMNKLANNLLKSNTAYLKLIHSYEILKRILYHINDSKKYSEKQIIGDEILDFKKNISFNNVSFSFNKKKIIFKSNLKFYCKKKTTIIGRSGSGKTTIVNLLLRLINCKSGNILIDNKPVNEIDLKSYRKLFGFVPQTPYFFYGSVKDNLSYGLSDITQKEIFNALEFANALEFIENLRKKENTIIKDGGENFSGGQLQRLSVARALLQKPKIIILDEPTNGLDPQASERMIELINKLATKMTIICISHSFKVIKNSDYIILLNNGKILENDKYDILKKNSAVFNNFIN